MDLTYRNELGRLRFTELGKRDAILAVKIMSPVVESKDTNFNEIVKFIIKYFNKSIFEALYDGVNEFENNKLYQIYRIRANKEKLATWFDAFIENNRNILGVVDYKENGLTGESIVSYFTSEEYLNKIKEFGYVSTIKDLTENLEMNTLMGYEDFLNTKKLNK